MQPEVDRDELLVHCWHTASGLRDPDAIAITDAVRNDGAAERLVKKKRDALMKDSSNIDALLEYILHLGVYLRLELPDKRDLFQQPLGFLALVLDQTRRGGIYILSFRGRFTAAPRKA